MILLGGAFPACSEAGLHQGAGDTAVIRRRRRAVSRLFHLHVSGKALLMPAKSECLVGKKKCVEKQNSGLVNGL